MIDTAKAVILLGHGSRVASANAPLATVVGWCAERMEDVRVEPAFLQLATPGLEETVEGLVAEGIKQITVVPFFLYQGAHVREDIPELVATLRSEYPQIKINLGEHLGVHPLMADIVAERAEKAN